MSDAIVVIFVFSALLVTLKYPFVGLLTWAWFTLMTPHQMAYGTFGIPLNTVIACVTIASLAVHREFNHGGLDVITGLLVLFTGWLFVTQEFSLNATNSAEYFDRFVKTMLFVILCSQIASDKLRLHALLWVFVLSVGYFGAKGALFTIATLGENRVQGIPRTILEDNNHMGIALATTLPLILYLREQVKHAYVKTALLVLFVMTIISIIGTQSRGAFISLVVFGGFYWLQSKHKITIFAALSVVIIPAIAFMPAKWTDRMSTIREATQDASFMGRVDAWIINTKLAQANPITGAGLRNSYHSEIAETIDPAMKDRARAAHSIYFEILGGTGFVGLGIYLSILFMSFFSARGLFHNKRLSEDQLWISRFGYYTQISLAVFFVGGASVSLEMWDGYWVLIALTAAVTRMDLSGTKPVGHALEKAKKARWRMAARGRSIKP